MNNATEKKLSHEICHTCSKPASHPFRRHDPNGKIIHGCVDVFHNEALRGIVSESAHWHFRAEAKQIRRDSNKFKAIYK